MPTQRLLISFNHLIHNNLLLMGIIGAIWMSMYHPVPAALLEKFNMNAILIAIIFVIQGLTLSFKGAGNFRRYGTMVLAAIFVSIVMYPLLAHLFSLAFDLKSDFHIGFLLLSSLPNPLGAAMAMAATAGGDPLTSIILLVSLNLAAIISIPLNLSLWLGNATPVSEMLVMKTLLFYLFIPAAIGQFLRLTFPKVPDMTKDFLHAVPMVCIVLLVYTSCSRESALFHSLHVNDLAQIITPCILLHVIMLIMAYLIGKFWLKLNDKPTRAFLFITSDKPLSLSVALWSMTYAKHHPLAIFPILVFYVGQVIFDSIVVSRLIKSDILADEQAKKES